MVDEERVVVQREVADTPVSQGGPAASQSVTEETVRRRPSGAEVARRVVVFAFGIVQVLILLRIVLLLVGANDDNALVAAIYDISGLFVAPFEGVMGRDSVRNAGAVLDIAAVVALIGWTLLEGLILAAISIARREP
jgi:YGGT family